MAGTCFRCGMFAISELKSADIERAYPVARLMNPRLSLADWRSYVAFHCRCGNCGLLAAASPNQVIFGLAAWWIRPNLGSELILWSGPLVAVEPGAPGRVHEALAAALSETARERGCDAVYIVQPGEEPGSPLPHLDFIWYGAVLQRRLTGSTKDAAA